MNDLPIQLQEHQYVLQKLDPATQTIPYRHQHWATHFANDSDFGYLVGAYPGTISRENITEVSRQAHQQHDSTWIRRLFLATMMWGYGPVGNDAPPLRVGIPKPQPVMAR